jgi:hypothetical protein
MWLGDRATYAPLMFRKEKQKKENRLEIAVTHVSAPLHGVLYS